MNFGEILKNLMRDEGITQAELAKSVGYTQRAVSKWVNNQSEPTETAITKCAEFFNVSTDYLLGKKEFDIAVAPIGATITGYSAEEKQLIEDFRKLSPYMKGIALTTVHSMTGAKPDDLHKKA